MLVPGLGWNSYLVITGWGSLCHCDLDLVTILIMPWNEWKYSWYHRPNRWLITTELFTHSEKTQEERNASFGEICKFVATRLQICTGSYPRGANKENFHLLWPTREWEPLSSIRDSCCFLPFQVWCSSFLLLIFSSCPLSGWDLSMHLSSSPEPASDYSHTSRFFSRSMLEIFTLEEINTWDLWVDLIESNQ